MHGPPRYINSVIVGEQSKQLRVPTYMLNTRHRKDVYTRIFIDCGADINCIDIDFAKKHQQNVTLLGSTVQSCIEAIVS